MKISNQQYAVALFATLADCPKSEVAVRISNFLKILQKNKQLKNLGQIINHFVEYYRQQNNILTVQATVAQEADLKDLRAQIKGRLNQDIELEVNIDPTILAGLILKIGDTLIDGSADNQLNLLKNKLTTNN